MHATRDTRDVINLHHVGGRVMRGVMLLLMNDVDEIKVMWDEWRAVPFPAEYAGKDVEGICVTSLDSYAAGCIDTFVTREGNLDAGRVSVLEGCRKDLMVVLSGLDGDARRYFECLLQIAEKVLSLARR
jgi:hypothetical protein